METELEAEAMASPPVNLFYEMPALHPVIELPPSRRLRYFKFNGKAATAGEGRGNYQEQERLIVRETFVVCYKGIDKQPTAFLGWGSEKTILLNVVNKPTVKATLVFGRRRSWSARKGAPDDVIDQGID